MPIDYTQFKELDVSFASPGVLLLEFNRPKSGNIITAAVWKEYARIFRTLAADPDVRVVVVAGKGKHLAAGIQLTQLRDLIPSEIEDPSRMSYQLYHFIREFQEEIKTAYDCGKPTIAVAHGASIGLTMDLLVQFDMRFAAKNAVFAAPEVMIGMAADVGTIQSISKVVRNSSWVREIIFTGRDFSASEAYQQGFVSRLFETKDEALQTALAVARDMAECSPVATHGIKNALNYSREHTLEDGLKHIAQYAAVANETDMRVGVTALKTKQKPVYENAPGFPIYTPLDASMDKVHALKQKL